MGSGGHRTWVGDDLSVGEEGGEVGDDESRDDALHKLRVVHVVDAVSDLRNAHEVSPPNGSRVCKSRIAAADGVVVLLVAASEAMLSSCSRCLVLSQLVSSCPEPRYLLLHNSGQ
eukprot:3791263-Rhodomonas_salina.1